MAQTVAHCYVLKRQSLAESGDSIIVVEVEYLDKKNGLIVYVLLFKGYQRGSPGKNHQKSDYLKQAMRLSCLPTGFEPAAFGLPLNCFNTCAKKTSKW